jgi:hypothetical protein
MADVPALMKRCQIGVPRGPNAYDDLHSILAECYGTLGSLGAENARLREALQALCVAADNMREASNWLPVVLGECDPPTDVYVPTKEEAIERYSDAFKSLERATYYARKSIRPQGGQP